MRLIRMIDDYVNDKKFSMIYKNGGLNVVNYSEIIDFSSTLISVRFEDKVYHIKGNNLVISRMMENEILVMGDIREITFS